jgi:alpha-tubulin suppressor-like RCC1 family protein
LWSWGTNDYGALGDNTVLARSSPVQVGALTTWSKISIFNSNDSVTAIKTDGTIWTWGNNTYGQLGDNTGVDKSSPIQLGALTTWSQSASGGFQTLAIKTDGTLWSWGTNDYGQLGDNTRINKSSPIQVGALTTWSKIASGRKYAIAIKTDGTLWSFGYGTVGNLGDGTAVHRSSPVQVGSLTTWSQISASFQHSAAIKTDGTIWTWGYNNYGQLGDSTTIDRSSPTQIGALTTWSQISVGSSALCIAIKTDGTMWGWGKNNYGQLGDNTQTYRSSPVQIGAQTTWAKIAAGDLQGFGIAAS